MDDKAATFEPAATADKCDEGSPITPKNTRLKIVGKAFLYGEIPVAITRFGGQLSLCASAIERSSVNVRFEMASAKARFERLTNFLKGPNFLDAARYPESTFRSLAVRAPEARGASKDTLLRPRPADPAAARGRGAGKMVEIEGELTLHGVKKRLIIEAEVGLSLDAKGKSEPWAHASFVLDRHDFHLLAPPKMEPYLNQDVLIELDVDMSR